MGQEPEPSDGTYTGKTEETIMSKLNGAQTGSTEGLVFKNQ